MADVGFGFGGVLAAEEALYKQAQTEKTDVETDLKAHELQAMRRFSDLASQREFEGDAGGEDAGDPSEIATNRLYRMSMDALNSGLPKLGGQLAGQAAQVRQRTAAGKKSEADAALHTIQSEIRAAELLARHVNNDTVTDEESWQAAWANLGMEAPGEYTPDRVTQIQRAALSERDVLQERYRRDNLASIDPLRQARIQDILNRRPLVAAQIRLTNNRNRVLEREGDTSVVKPAELKEATDLIGSRYDGLAKEELGMHGREIIRDAKRLVAGNQALRYPEALRQALTNAETAGVFEGFTPREPGQPKPGGGGAPSQRDLDAAGALLLAEMPELRNKGDLQAAGKAIASRAKVIQKSREPDFMRAMQMALDEAVEAGDLPVTTDILGYVKKSYRPGTSAKTAKPLPKEPTMWRKDKWYEGRNGKKRQYLGPGKGVNGWGPEQ